MLQPVSLVFELQQRCWLRRLSETSNDQLSRIGSAAPACRSLLLSCTALCPYMLMRWPPEPGSCARTGTPTVSQLLASAVTESVDTAAAATVLLPLLLLQLRFHLCCRRAAASALLPLLPHLCCCSLVLPLPQLPPTPAVQVHPEREPDVLGRRLRLHRVRGPAPGGQRLLHRRGVSGPSSCLYHARCIMPAASDERIHDPRHERGRVMMRVCTVDGTCKCLPL